MNIYMWVCCVCQLLFLSYSDYMCVCVCVCVHVYVYNIMCMRYIYIYIYIIYIYIICGVCVCVCVCVCKWMRKTKQYPIVWNHSIKQTVVCQPLAQYNKTAYIYKYIILLYIYIIYIYIYYKVVSVTETWNLEEKAWKPGF